MKFKYRLFIAVVILLIFTSTFSSCAKYLPHNGFFDGGQILDDELMSEMKSKYLTEKATENTSETNKSANADTDEQTTAVSKTESETNTDESSTQQATDNFESTCETETDYITESTTVITESTTEITETTCETTEQKTVYWTEGGSVWHTNKDCRYLKNKNIISGSISEAEEKGKERICSTCNKNQ